MKPKILLLSNNMLFHYSFCSLYKNQFDIHPLLLRYLSKNLQSQTEHYYIQIQEQKRKKLFKSGLVTDPNRLILTNKSIQNIMDICEKNEFQRIVLEMNTGTKEEISLLRKISKTNIPINIFVSSADNDLIDVADHLNIETLYHLTDLFNCRVRF